MVIQACFSCELHIISQLHQRMLSIVNSIPRNNLLQNTHFHRNLRKLHVANRNLYPSSQKSTRMDRGIKQETKHLLFDYYLSLLAHVFVINARIARGEHAYEPRFFFSTNRVYNGKRLVILSSMLRFNSLILLSKFGLQFLILNENLRCFQDLLSA